MGGTQTSKPSSSETGSASDKSSEPGAIADQAEPEDTSGREYVAPRSVPVAPQPIKDDAPKIVLNLPEAAGPAGEREVEVARARRRSATVKISRNQPGNAPKGGARDEPTAVTGKHFDAPPELLVDLPSSPPSGLDSSGSRAAPTHPPPRPRTSRMPIVVVALIGVLGAGVWFIVTHTSEPPRIPAPTSAAAAPNTAAAGRAVVTAEPAPTVSAPVLTLTAPAATSPGDTPPEATTPPAAAGATVQVGPGTGVSGGSTQVPATPWVPPRSPARTAKPPTGKPPGDIPTSI